MLRYPGFVSKNTTHLTHNAILCHQIALPPSFSLTLNPTTSVSETHPVNTVWRANRLELLFKICL